jgi:hypothetical protein
MRLALQAGVRPVRLAEGVRVALTLAQPLDLHTLWPKSARESGEVRQISALLPH